MNPGQMGQIFLLGHKYEVKIGVHGTPTLYRGPLSSPRLFYPYGNDTKINLSTSVLVSILSALLTAFAPRFGQLAFNIIDHACFFLHIFVELKGSIQISALAKIGACVRQFVLL